MDGSLVIRYQVECQDCAGHRVSIDVTAETDEKACAAALAELNSWRAVRALPKIGGGAAPRGAGLPTATRLVAAPSPDDIKALDIEAWMKAPSNTASAELPSDPIVIKTGDKPTRRGQGPTIVHKATPRDWIGMHRAEPHTAVGRALHEAANAA